MKNTLIYKHKANFGTIFLKSRKNGSNPESLYLEIYLKSTQKRKLEFLGLYFTRNPIADNKIKQEAINRCISYSYIEESPIDLTYSNFFQQQIDKIDKPISKVNPTSTLNKLHMYANTKSLKFSQINEQFLLGFRAWLLKSVTNIKSSKPVSKSTANNHFSTTMSFTNRAQRKGYISHSAYSQEDIPAIGQVIKVPITLTEEEIIKLQSTYFHKQEICKAMMFQFACGQRWSDVRDMTWEQVIEEGGQYKIVLKQNKTDKILPSFISKDLIEWVSQGKKRTGKIFDSIPCHGTILRLINEWCKAAGIKKRIGTHTMRRSCATILFKKGVELLTISKILGHTTIDMTRRYIGIDEKDIKKGLEVLKGVTNQFTYLKAS